jgi:hypothetical protein
MRGGSAIAAAVLLSLTTGANESAADVPPPPPPPPAPVMPAPLEAPPLVSAKTSQPETPQPQVLAKPSPKRPLPNYDGRGAAPATVGDDLLWVPRIVVSPVYLTTEYVIRRPLGALISAAERSNVPQELYDFFVFGPDHKAGVLPTVFFDFGFSPSVGLFGFWNDAGFKGHDLAAHFSIWTSEWVAGSVSEAFHFGAKRKDVFTLKLAALRRPDRTFFGLGPSSLQDDISRYGETRLEASGTVDVPLWRSSQFEAGAGFRSVDIYNGDFGGDPSIQEESARGAYPLPYGFGRGYSDEFNHALIALDTRRRLSDGTGLRLEFQTEEGNDVRYAPASSWIRYQGTAGVFYDVNGRGRIISLSASALFADPLENGGSIPFTELVTLGGNTPILSSMASGTGLMPGFYPGRLVDRSAAVATLQYRWPIWAWLAGTMQVATGNVFGEHLEEFRPGLLRLSGALGIESTGISENALHILIGIGSETFDHGGQVDSIRLAFGTSRF